MFRDSLIQNKDIKRLIKGFFYLIFSDEKQVLGRSIQKISEIFEDATSMEQKDV